MQLQWWRLRCFIMKAGIPGPVSTLLGDINIITIVFVDNCLLGIAFEIFLTFYFFFI